MKTEESKLEPQQEQLDISVVSRSFSLVELKKAFEDGSWVKSWSDMGITMKYDKFEDWFKENYG
jgi:hypothetical protein